MTGPITKRIRNRNRQTLLHGSFQMCRREFVHCRSKDARKFLRHMVWSVSYGCNPSEYAVSLSLFPFSAYGAECSTCDSAWISIVRQYGRDRLSIHQVASVGLYIYACYMLILTSGLNHPKAELICDCRSINTYSTSHDRAEQIQIGVETKTKGFRFDMEATSLVTTV